MKINKYVKILLLGYKHKLRKLPTVLKMIKFHELVT